MHQVGAGVLGPVFRAYDPDADRTVAVKSFPLALTPEQADEFAAHLDQLTRLPLVHPAIIAPLAAGVEGSTAYLVGDYFVAESVDVALRQYGPAPVADALRLIGQLASALDFAAESGVHHGAIHARDILVAPSEVRLTGLGVAAALESVGFKLTPRRPYSAPERVAGTAWGAPADIYSLAMVAIELLTGRRAAVPPDGSAPDLQGVAAADRAALSEAFGRALAERPEDRYPTARAFAAALKHALAGGPLDTPSEPPKGKKGRGARAGGARGSTPEPPPPVEAPLPPFLAATVSSLDEPAPVEAPQAPPAPVTELPPYMDPAPERESAIPTGAVAGNPVPGPYDDMEPPTEKLPLSERRPGPVVPVTGVPEDVSPQPPVPLISTVPELPPASAVELPIEMGDLAIRLEETEPATDDGGLAGVEEEQPAMPLIVSDDSNVGDAPARQGLPLAQVAVLVLVGILGGLLTGYYFAARRPVVPAPAPVTAPPAATGGGAAVTPPTVVEEPTVIPATEPPSGRGAKPAGEATSPPSALAPAGRAAGSTPAGEAATKPAPAETKGRASKERPQVATFSARPHQRPAAPPKAGAPGGGAAAPAARTAPPPAPPTRAAAGEGSLVVISRPDGAMVVLDGHPVGRTPLTLPALTAGSHTVRLDREGYTPWSATIQVVAGRQTRVTASLDRGPEG